MWRTHLRGHTNTLKRLLVHSGRFNLGLLLHTCFSIGTRRGLQGRLAALVLVLILVWTDHVDFWRDPVTSVPRAAPSHPSAG
jgi:hypothetical protein